MQLEYNTDVFRVYNCRLGATSVSDDCWPHEYRSTVWMWAAPSCAFAFMMLVTMVLFFIGRYCCNCCGGRYHSPEFFCPPLSGRGNDSEDEQSGCRVFTVGVYSYCDLLRPKLLALSCAILSFTGCVWCCTGSTRLGAALSDMNRQANSALAAFSEANARALCVAQNATSLLKEHESSDGLAQIASALPAMMAASESALHNLADDSIHALASRVQKYRWLCYPLTILSMLASLIVATASCLHCRRRVPAVLLACVAVLAVSVFAFHGVLLAGEHLLRDWCREVTDFGRGHKNVLSAVVGCPSEDKEDPREDAADAVRSAWDAYSEIVTSFTADTCARLVYWSRVDVGLRCHDHSVDTSSLLLALSESALIPVGPSPASLELPLEALAELRSRRANLVSLLAAQHNGVARSCEDALQMVVPGMQEACECSVAGAHSAAQGCGLAGLSLVVAMLALVLGTKRFMPLSQAFIPQGGRGGT